jgi:signal transduction histidine kinase
MLMPASSEFVALCQAQVALITQTWGAAFSAVYLTENWAQDSPTDLIPVFIYPDNSNFRSDASPPRLPTAEPQTPPTVNPLPEIIHLSRGSDLPDLTLPSSKPERIVLPLIHDGIVLGLLVVGREDRQWHPREQEQLQQVARTLAIACVLDQRQQWLGQTNFQQRSLQAQQYDTLANLLHQFRNPLTTVRTVGKLLRKRLLPADNNRNLATNIINESDRLQQLLEQFDQVIDIGEAALEHPETSSETLTLGRTALPGSAQPLLALAAAPTVGRPLHLQPCWLTEILEPLLMSAATIAQERNLALHLELPTDLPPVQADPPALREAITNLVDNALKYTPSGGQVQLQVQRHPTHHQQTITISDTGMGIPATDLPRLFERHYRGVQAQGNISGTGLGLAIARELIEQMQGQIQALSPAQWRPAGFSSTDPGSTFIITLPEIQRSTGVAQKQKQPGSST